MTPEEIKSRLKEKGLTLSDVARRANVTHTAVHLTINKRAKSKNIDKHMARALGMKLAQYREEMNHSAPHHNTTEATS